MNISGSWSGVSAVGPYSQAIVAGGLVFCSGMAGIDPATGEIPDGIEAQTEQGVVEGIASWIDYGGRTFQIIGYTPQGGYRTYGGELQRTISSFRRVTDAQIIAEGIGGELFDCVCRFEPGAT